jgi:hypothetical protein
MSASLILFPEEMSNVSPSITLVTVPILSIETVGTITGVGMVCDELEDELSPLVDDVSSVGICS